MRELLLQGDVSVPTSTSGQTALAAIITVLLLVTAVVAYRRSKVLGLSDEEKQVREDVRAQRRQRTAAELKLSIETVQELTEAELQRRFIALFDTTPEETITRLPAAAKRVSSAVSSAWDQRVGWLPALARRAVGLAGAVVVLGAVAVSGDAVVRLLQTDPSTPSTGSITSSIRAGIEWSIGIVGSYPYAGTLWELAYATAILSIQWLYRQWALIAAVLVVSAVSIVLLDRRLDDEVVPERMIQSRRLALGAVIVGVVGVWLAGAAPVAVASVVGRRRWPASRPFRCWLPSAARRSHGCCNRAGRSGSRSLLASGLHCRVLPVRGGPPSLACGVRLWSGSCSSRPLARGQSAAFGVGLPKSLGAMPGPRRRCWLSSALPSASRSSPAC